MFRFRLCLTTDGSFIWLTKAIIFGSGCFRSDSPSTHKYSQGVSLLLFPPR